MEVQAFDTLTWSTSVVLSAASLRKKIQCIVCGCMCVSRCVLTVNQILNIVLLDWLHINKVEKIYIFLHGSEAFGSKLQIFQGSFVSQFPEETWIQRKQQQIKKFDLKASEPC